jgi:tripartite-type tricarboxylate transporter receptor subunit TctC
MKRRKTIVACLCLLACVLTPAFAAERLEPFPQRPIKLVVPWAPGGFTDSLARLVSEQMARVLGQSMIVENRPGANGIMGTESVARSAPDGYTLLIATAETHAINPSTYPRLRYDAVTDFTPAGSIASVPLFLVTSVDLTEKSFPELMAAARRSPGKFKYASWGAGSTGHLAFELLNAPVGVEMIHVPYKGLGPALTDVMSGQEDMTLARALAAGVRRLPWRRTDQVGPRCQERQGTARAMTRSTSLRRLPCFSPGAAGAQPKASELSLLARALPRRLMEFQLGHWTPCTSRMVLSYPFHPRSFV